MSAKIKFLYCLKHVKHQIFSLSISKDSTVEDVLALVSEKRNENCTSLFYKRIFEMDLSDLITDYLEDDPEYIFIISLDSVQPSSSLYAQLISVPPDKSTKIEPPKPTPKIPPPKIPPPKPMPKIPPPKPMPKIPPQKPMPKLPPQKPISPKLPEPKNEHQISPQLIKAPCKAQPQSHVTPSVITPSIQYTPKNDNDQYQYKQNEQKFFFCI